MFALALLSIPLAFVWMILTNTMDVGGFVVGYLLGGALLLLMGQQQVKINHKQLPDQIAALGIYLVTLARDVWLSSVDVARRVLDPNLPLDSGIISVHTLDKDENEVTAAVSAHGITLTPGELVVEFDGGKTMYVHCLDVHASCKSAPGAQVKRLALIHRIAGKATEKAMA